MSVLVSFALFYTVTDNLFLNLPGDVPGSACISPVWLERCNTVSLRLYSLPVYVGLDSCL